MTPRLYRSRTDRMLGGVCGGLAHYFDVDPAIVRLVFVALALASGAGVLMYVLMWVLVPEEPIEGGFDVSDATPHTTPEPGAPAPTPLDEAAAMAAANPPTYSAPTSETAPPAAPQAPAPVPTPVRSVPRERRSGGVTGGLILIGVGIIFLVSEFVPGVDIGKLWPLILVAIGIAIIFRRR